MIQRGKILLVTGCILLIHHLAGAQDQVKIDTSATFNLQQCVSIALANNPTVKQAEFTMRAAHVTLQGQRGSMYPNVSGSANFINNTGRNINPANNQYINSQYTSSQGQVTGSIVLWNGSSIQNYIRQYSLNYEAARLDWQQTKDQLIINVILAYLNVLSSREQLNMAEAQIEATKGKVQLLEAQNREGAIVPSVLTDMRGQLASDELTAVSTKNSLETYRLTLSQLMNTPYTPGLKLASISTDSAVNLYDATVDQIYQSALQNLAQVRAADLHLASAEKGLKATRGNMAPTLSLIGGISSNYSSLGQTSNSTFAGYDTAASYSDRVLYNGNWLPVYKAQFNTTSQKISFLDQYKNNRGYYYGLNLNIPIMNGFRLRNQYRQAQINRDQAAFTATTTRIQLKQAVEQDYVNMQAAYRTFQAYSTQVENYQESFRAAEIRFSVGAVSAASSLDYLNAKNNFDRSTLNQIQAKYNYILQTKVLDYFQGKLSY